VGKWTRRALLATGGLIGGGLVLGVGGLIVAPNRLGVRPEEDGTTSRLTTWIKIGTDNLVTVVVPHCEMGQGVHTALAMMLAEELEADWQLVRVEEAPAQGAFANGYLVPVFVPYAANPPRLFAHGVEYGSYKLSQMLDLQVTGGSSSVRGTGHLGMRTAGAAAKDMLCRAAALKWNVPADECSAEKSRIVHAPSQRSATYGELASIAANLDPPDRPILKRRSKYSIVGTARPRIDIPSKVNGSAIFGIDIALPDMLYATVSAAPVFGAKLVSVDASVAANLPGVRRVVQLENAVAVVADSYWRALKALRLLKPEYSAHPGAELTSAKLYESVGLVLDREEGRSLHSSGDVESQLQQASNVVAAEYRVPFLAHATMEPMNTTARVADGGVELWTGVQDPLAARKVASRAAGVESERVTVHNQHLGGGFGRRLPGNHDFVDQAVRIAKEMSPLPVKLIWSREEDIQHDYYRPAVLARFKGVLDQNARATVWASRFNGLDGTGSEATECPYAIEHRDIRAFKDSHHIRVGAWRSVAHSEHGFFTESFIDELANAAQQDPLEFRLSLLEDRPRHRRVLERVAKMANWSEVLDAGRARGIAVVECFGSVVAEVAEVTVRDGAIKVDRVFAAVDCGEVINPDTAAAQIEGGIIFALSAALFDQITIQQGAVAQTNFHDYPLPKLADAPRIVVAFVESDAPIGGLGEPGVPPLAPAVANAVFAATGTRLRTLPLKL
jgi:isoquinoline 1-oxidoreductase beta subunit